MSKTKSQILVTFIVYVSRDHMPVHMEGFLSSLVYLKKHQESQQDIQVILVNANSNPSILDVIKSYEKEFKLIYFKVTNDLGPTYAYNLAMPYIQGKYCHFISPTYTVEPFYLDYLNKTIVNSPVNPDLILLYNSRSLNNYELKNLSYKGMSKELILGLYTNLKYYVINTEFLKQSNVYFKEFSFRTFDFIANLLIESNLLAYIPTQLIESRFKPINTFNAYDILYQTYDILVLLNEKGVYEKYKHEWDYLLISNVYSVFLGVLCRSVDIDLDSKSSIKENAQLLNPALVSIKNLTMKLGINIHDNPYLNANNNKSVFDTYNKIVKVVK